MNNIKDNRPPFGGLSDNKINRLLTDAHTPAYIIDEEMLKRNGEILRSVQDKTGCKILLAQKAFSNYNMYPLISDYLAGTEASGLYEARLGYEEMPGKEVHVFCGAYKEAEIEELIKYADHIVFNSVSQLEKYGKRCKDAGKSVGLRINPEHSTQEGHEIYDPCAPGSRLGVTFEAFGEKINDELINLLDGLHFHTLCEQNSDALWETVLAVEEKFGDYLGKMKWINFGGGHHITREDYDLELLKKSINYIKDKYDVQVYLEPGEAVALNAGYLVSEILDKTKNGDTENLIIDASAACHMPDVIEMPYRPPLFGGYEPGEKAFTYRLGGATCLAGDVVGDYSFEKELNVGDKIIFGDMAIYTTCKNNTFNGMPLPCIYSIDEGGSLKEFRSFGYEDFKTRLGK
ncbi:MAG: carboxynorspermidine decarboxylase [Lachnospiraceae bacterium]|nr:carboxynorspermidine decarboxylase [Lachnospiraceae bacterium]